MPTALRITSPNAPPLYAWLQAEVVRIGSAGDCDIRIDGVVAHLATIVFRDPEFYVVNRSESSLLFAGKPLASGAEAIWRPSDKLGLPQGVVIELIPHRDRRPQPLESGSPMPEYDAPEQERTATRRRHKQLACYAITAAALFVTGAMRTWNASAPSDAQYVRIVESLQAYVEKSPEEGRQLQHAADWIKAAHSSELRGQTEPARQRYVIVRDLLDSAANPEIAEIRRQTLAYVATRLEAL